MIGSLRGVLEECTSGESAAEVVVDVGGVGYRVFVTGRTATGIGPVGSPVALKIHTHVREGAFTLYGFATTAERQCFELLVATHGVGPALALAILGLVTPAELAVAVAAGDLDALCRVPGIGRKTATRLVVELGERLEVFADYDAVGAGRGREAGVAESSGARAVVAEALAGLGYASDEVRSALAELSEDGAPEELLKAALVSLAPR